MGSVHDTGGAGKTNAPAGTLEGSRRGVGTVTAAVDYLAVRAALCCSRSATFTEGFT
jgi:hypothetical protein